MAFKKKQWKDRIAEFINRRVLTLEDGSTMRVTVARDEGTISEEGDAFSAKNMDDLEERIEKAITELNSKYEDCFQSVSNGKAKVASAITGKGVTTASDATFDVMASNISTIPVGKCIYLGTGTSFNVQSVCATYGIDYKKLTGNNFIAGASSAASNGSKTSGLQLSAVYGYASVLGFSVSKSYNASTGVLSLGGTSHGLRVFSTVTGSDVGYLYGGVTLFAYLFINDASALV